MSNPYVFTTFDNYDPNSNLFITKKECIQWNTYLLGKFDGPTYETLEECYKQHIDEITSVNGVGSGGSGSFIPICNISIASVATPTALNNFIISLTEEAYNGQIFFQLIDDQGNNIFAQPLRLFCCRALVEQIDTYPNPISGSITYVDGQAYYGPELTAICAIEFFLVQDCNGCPEPTPPRSYAPVEDSGLGSAGAHWEDADRAPEYPTPDGLPYPGITYDIMKATLGTSNISSLSVSNLIDMGYSSDPGLLFDRCSFQDAESSIIADLPDVLDNAASRWETYVSLGGSVFNAVYNLIELGGSDGGGGGSDGGGSDGGGSGDSGDSGGSGGSGGSGCADFGGIRLNFIIEADDGPGYIAACTVDEFVSLGGVKVVPISFSLYINTYYSNFSRDTWKIVMTHELGHALGIGSLWQPNPEFWLYKEDYPETIKAYNDNLPPENLCDIPLPSEPSATNIQYTSNTENFAFQCGCGKGKFFNHNSPKKIGELNLNSLK